MNDSNTPETRNLPLVKPKLIIRRDQSLDNNCGNWAFNNSNWIKK